MRALMKGLFAMIALALCLVFPPLGILLFFIWIACAGTEQAARSVPAPSVSPAHVFPRDAQPTQSALDTVVSEGLAQARRRSLAIKLVASESAEDFIKKI